MASRPEPTWLLDANGEPDYAATAIAMSKGTAPDQIKARETRKARASAAEAEEVPKKAINTLASPSTKLYHGTDHIFGPGETVDGYRAGTVQAVRNINPSWKESKNVYSTTSLDEAKDYAGTYRSSSRFSPVYEVNNDTSHSLHSLIGQDPMLRNHSDYTRDYVNTYVSQKSLTPKAIVAWGESPEHKHLSPQFASMLGAYSSMTGAPNGSV